MTIEAALPAPDLWERDLMELLGLNDASNASGAGHKRAFLFAAILAAFALVASCLFEVRRRSVSPMVSHALVTRVIAERSNSTRPTVVITEPAPPAPPARASKGRNKAAMEIIDRPGSGAGSYDRLASAPPVAPAISLASRTTIDRHSALKPALQSKQASSLMISRTSIRKVILFDKGHLPKRSILETRKTNVSAIHEPLQSDDTNKALPDNRDQSLPNARETTPSDEVAAYGRQPLPPTQRFRSGQKETFGQKNEAIDAIRLLRRQ